MLQELKIKNFAVIDQLTVHFNPGLNIISGETGAGKSVIITALDLVLGGRASAEYIRTSAQQMVIEAGFNDLNASLINKLERYGIEVDDVLVLRRRLSRQGKNSCYANDSLISLTTLSDIGQELVDIHGQHQHQLLMRSENHLDFLDNMGDLLSLRQDLFDLFSNWQIILKKQKQLENRKQQQSMKQELAAFQAQEIEQANLGQTEEQDLKSERSLLLNAGNILENGQWAHQALYAAEGSVSEVLSQVKAKIKELSHIDTRLSDLGEAAESLVYQVEDLACTLNGYLANLEYDPARHQEIEDRLSLIEGLKRKYGPSIKDILNFYQTIANELDDLSNIDQDLKSLAVHVRESAQRLQEIAGELSQKRKEASKRLAGMMEKELAQLGMPESVFRVDFKSVKQDNSSYEGNAQGLEEIEFLFSANPGEAPKSLAKVASGGELSRIMLALKSLLAGRDKVGSLVFDEVDVGIGGKIAEVVGRKLQQSAQFQQVICITHLPQIAALAQHHYTVNKVVDQGQTFTNINQLSQDARIKEVARMLAGAEITPSALNHAQKMING